MDIDRASRLCFSPDYATARARFLDACRVFGIAVGRVWQEVEGQLASLPGEPAEGDATSSRSADDELSARRAARRTAG